MLRDNKILYLYNDDGYCVLASNKHKEIAEFLGKSLGTTYSTISRMKTDNIKHIFSKDGQRYSYELVDAEDVQQVIEDALEFIWSSNVVTNNMKTPLGRFFNELERILEKYERKED